MVNLDLMTQKFISFRDAQRLIPGAPHVSTLQRWRLNGLRGTKLETWLIGGKRFTTVAALQSFLTATSSPAGATATGDQIASDEEAAHRLSAKGL